MQIEWFINGVKLGKVPNRVNMGKSSILGFTELSTDKTGTYACRFGETVLVTHMIVRESRSLAPYFSTFALKHELKYLS